MHILIVEDQDNMAVVMQRLIAPVRKAWPDCAVTWVITLAAAKHIIASTCPPDVTVLDLSLNDSSVDATIAQIPHMKENTAIIVVTGHYEVVPRIPEGIPIIKKDEGMSKSFALVVARAFLSRPNGPWAQADKAIERMKELEQQLTHVS